MDENREIQSQGGENSQTKTRAATHSRRPFSLRTKIAAAGIAALAALGLAEAAAPETPVNTPGTMVNEVGNVAANTAIGAVELVQDMVKKTGEPNQVYIGNFNVKDLNKLTIWPSMSPTDTMTGGDTPTAKIDIKQVSSLDGTRIDIQGLTGISFTNATIINKNLPYNADQNLGPNIEIVAQANVNGNEQAVYIPLGQYNAGIVEEVPGGNSIPLELTPDGKYKAPGLNPDQINIVTYTSQNGGPVTQPITPENAPQN